MDFMLRTGNNPRAEEVWDQSWGPMAPFPVSVFQGSEKERDLLPAGEQEHQDWIPVLLTRGLVLSLLQHAAS